jgi:type IV secretory pathway VirB2 component (pilin)
MKTSTKKIIVFIVTLILMVSMASMAFALDPSQITPSTSVEGTTSIQEVGQSIFGIIQVVGVVLSVIILAIIGIKYMIGSAEEKAEYKKTFIPYIVGAVLIFGASTLANVVYQFVIKL